MELETGEFVRCLTEDVDSILALEDIDRSPKS